MEGTTKKRRSLAKTLGNDETPKEDTKQECNPPVEAKESVELKTTPDFTSAKYTKYYGVSERDPAKGSHKRVYTCLVGKDKTEERDEPTKEFPMYIAMANLCITPTGFTDSKLRDELCSKIQLMCGELSMAYTNRTTHLLAAHANTTKVELARDRDLSVVTEDWIESLWNACQQNTNPYIHASLPQFKDSAECPLFYNLNFVFSKRYDLDSKQFYEKLLLANGGIVGNTLKRGPTYFYICQEPETERLYHQAQAKDVPCLPLAWIIESMHRNNLAKIAEFEVRGKELNGFGTTFDVGDYGPVARQSLPTPNYPLDKSLNGGRYSSPNINYLDIGSGFSAMENEFSFDDETSSSSSTLFGDDNNSVLDVGDVSGGSHESGNISILENTTVAANDTGKGSLVDSLTFTGVAG